MTNLLKFFKTNLFLISVILAYIFFLYLSPQTSLQGIKNSGFYLKEMLMIMPVIFVLTSLLDSWVPKNTIIRFLGQKSGIKGTILSFVLGSISAGPIYAAFPFCVMLHKKGASIRNVVIILSSWAVIKIPMLLNEVKFLGFKFMIIRWILTIIAILIFAWITSKIVKDNDIPQVTQEKPGVCLNHNACMGCTICTKIYPEIFYMEAQKATVRTYDYLDSKKLQNAINSCPVKAIVYND